jgi:hypothetical protein
MNAGAINNTAIISTTRLAQIINPHLMALFMVCLLFLK